jgi:RHS repeat-associated protein
LSSLRAHFEYQVDGRGNRTRAYERLAQPTTITDTYDKDAAEVDYTAGTWTDAGDFKQSTQFSARMTVTWTGDEGLLTVGTGPDHSIFDVYIGGSLWQSYDCYAADPGERVIHIPADGVLEIRNRADRNIQSTGYVIRFKQLEVLEVTYDERTIQYTYDALSRLIEADYDSGTTVYTYGFDLAGNLTNLNGASRTYNAANQLVNDGTNTLTYDANGNMTSDGVNSYVWDRANRLLSMGGVSYTYNGDGNRIRQDALKYILDLQPRLAQVIGDSDGNRYIHGPRGIHAVSDGADWQFPLTDGLGSVRGYVSTNNAVLLNVNYTPVGVPDTNIIGPAFTGEWRSGNETQYHRARHLHPGLGVWLSLDPFEGVIHRPMSLNGYSWVEGNTPDLVDPTGKCNEVHETFWQGIAADEIPIPTGHTIQEVVPWSGDFQLGVALGRVSWNYSWQSNGGSGDNFQNYEVFANTQNQTYYMYFNQFVYGTCDTNNKRNCARYSYTGLYSAFKLRLGRAPKLGELVAIVFRGELGVLVDFLGEESIDEAFGRNFYSVVGTSFTYENLINFLKDSQFWIDRSANVGGLMATRITSGRYDSLLGITTQELLEEGIANLEFTDIAQRVLDSEDWREGQVPGRPARWGNKIYRKKRLTDNSIVELTQAEMIQWIINNTNANVVFAAGDVATCAPEKPNAGSKLIGVVVDSADIGVETCDTPNLSLVVSNDSFQRR